MRKILLVGIGAGDPDHLTVQAIKAINRAHAVFIPFKGAEKEALRRARLDICARFVDAPGPRLVEYAVPARDAEGGYREGVAAWHARSATLLGDILRRELAEGECGAFLVWGDPSLYDSTSRLVELIRTREGLALDHEVIPGISSVQALAARHRVPLNRIGEAVHVTTGRQLARELPKLSGNVVVMLDGEQAFAHVDGDAFDIFWGAYLGTADEILVSGRLSEVGADIERLRAAARGRHGWVMDTYLLRRRDGA